MEIIVVEISGKEKAEMKTTVVSSQQIAASGFNLSAAYHVANAEKVATERTVSEIAREIFTLWKPVHPWAKPYLEAMTTLNRVTDNYINDSGEEVILRFLGNAKMWRGDDARRIKAELNALLKPAKGRYGR